jgi:hypothetical protein
MKKKTQADDELRPEYDLQKLLEGGVRGKYAAEDPGLSRLEELSALGVVSRAPEVQEAPGLAPFEPIASRGASMAQAIDEDREDRF